MAKYTGKSKINSPFRNIPENGIKFPEPREPRVLNSTKHDSQQKKVTKANHYHIYKWREWFNTIQPREWLTVTIQPEHEFCQRNPEFAGKTVLAEVHAISHSMQTIYLKVDKTILGIKARAHFTVVFEQDNPFFLQYNPVRILSRKHFGRAKSKEMPK